MKPPCSKLNSFPSRMLTVPSFRSVPLPHDLVTPNHRFIHSTLNCHAFVVGALLFFLSFRLSTVVRPMYFCIDADCDRLSILYGRYTSGISMLNSPLKLESVHLLPRSIVSSQPLWCRLLKRPRKAILEWRPERRAPNRVRQGRKGKRSGYADGGSQEKMEREGRRSV